ncbi:MAG: DUF368 domain-containing protein [Elusimicrobiota bacterium]
MLVNIIKGALIGMANIIPGVSGGTFALILGIYTPVVESMNRFLSVETLNRLIKRKEFKIYFKSSGGFFLFQLLLGMLLSIVLLSWIISFFIEVYPGQTLSFFLGLILASVSIPLKMVNRHSFSNRLFLLPGIIIVIGVYLGWFGHVFLPSPALPYVFLSGAAAISAMILPGLSGSFVLLLMGSYEYIVEAVRMSSAGNFYYMKVVLVFGLGCLAGLVIFARLMKFLLNKHRDRTLYFLTGLVLGSVVILWPFKDYLRAESVFTAPNTAPGAAGELLLYGAFLILGFVSSSVLEKLAKAKTN